MACHEKDIDDPNNAFMEHASLSHTESAWGYRRFDVWLFRWMRAGHGARPRLLPVARWISHRSWFPLLITLVAMCLPLPSGGWLLLQVLCVATAAQVMSKKCAVLWGAPRPFALGLSHNHLKHGPRAGLPSTHAAVMGAVVGFMAAVLPLHPLLAVLGAIALLTAWARVYAGAHFPCDVVAGLGLGVGAGWAAARFIHGV